MTQLAQSVGTWKRFRPALRGRLDDATVYEPDSLYSRARRIVDSALHDTRQRGDALKRTQEAVRYLKLHPTHKPEYLLALLVLQGPSAARAQREMDRHHGGYKNRQARLFELIDFNDTFVDTVLALEREQLKTFTDRLRAEIDTFCQRVGVEPFSDKQYQAIVHGLSREIAVFRGAQQLGYHVRMTSRVQDSMGVDMIITDTEQKKSLAIDVKTHSSFHFRLLDLQHQNRLNEERRLQCELAGYCFMRNGNGYKAVETILLRIATDRLGEIHHYEFVDLKPFGELLAHAIRDHGKYIV